MRKLFFPLAMACSLAFVSTASATERDPVPSTQVESGFITPAPQTADRASLAQSHAAATPADQAKTAGRVPTMVVIVGAAVLVGVITVVSG